MAGTSVGADQGPRPAFDLNYVDKRGIRTEFGPVGLRSIHGARRAKCVLQVDRKAKNVDKDWLKADKQEVYRKCVKQSMLVAYQHIRLCDAYDSFTKMDNKEKVIKEATQLKKAYMDGQKDFQVPASSRMVTKQVSQPEDRQRNLLVKYSSRPYPSFWCSKRERLFIIERDELWVYGSRAVNAQKRQYKLKDFEVPVLEKLQQGTIQYPYFEVGHKQRLKVEHKERKHEKKGAFFLYAESPKDLKNWQRAFRWSKDRDSQHTKGALINAIRRVVSSRRRNPYDCLFVYFRELQKLNKTLKNMVSRVSSVDLSRGWEKMKMVSQKQSMEEKMKNKQQEWALRWIETRLEKVGASIVKPVPEIRESVVTHIQSKFRMYRESRIFDRTYPIGKDVIPRVRKARQGMDCLAQIEGLTWQDSLRLCLTDEVALEHLEAFSDSLKTKKATYSEVLDPQVGAMHIRTSDNFQNLLFVPNEAAGDADLLPQGEPNLAQLNKTKFSNFICVDRISCVVLNTCPRQDKNGAGNVRKEDAGVWCTVYGPRLAYGIAAADPGQGAKDNQGAKDDQAAKEKKDGFAVPKALAESKQVKCITMELDSKLSVRLSSAGETAISSLVGDDNNAPPADQKDQKAAKTQTYAVMHILGNSFKSKLREAKSISDYTFEKAPKAMVPVSADADALVALDSSMVGVELFIVEESPSAAKKTTLAMAGSKSLLEVYGKKTFKGETSLQGKSVDLTLYSSNVESGTLSVSVKAQDAKTDPSTPVSPEFGGGGVGTTLYTSHRGAWYDPVIGAGHFRVDHVANFVELKLDKLQFPVKAEKSKSAGPEVDDCFRIRASIGGVSVTSRPMHRPKDTWTPVIGPQNANPNLIDFHGMRLFLPLPPGCWKSRSQPKPEATPETNEAGKDKTPAKDEPKVVQEKRPNIQVEIIEGRDDQGTSVGYGSNGGSKTKSTLKPQYFALIEYEQLVLVDQVKSVCCFLEQDKKKTPVTTVGHYNIGDGQQDLSNAATLKMDCVLRDRDYVRCSMGKVGDQRDLYIGDKVMVVVESPLEYPADKTEYRHRFCKGQPSDAKKGKTDFDEKKKEWEGKKCPLRPPATPGEFQISRLGTCIPKIPFKQAVVPTYCRDIIPHQFVCPRGELEFDMDNCPGVYPKVVDELVAKFKDSTLAKQRVVETLTHVNQQIPGTLIATYPSSDAGVGTCDVELAPEFVESWRTCWSKRKFYLPGTVKTIKKAKDPDEEGDRYRIFLLGIPTMQVRGTHAAGFHVFNSGFQTTEDVCNSDLAPIGDYDLTGIDPHKNQDFTLAAGPLPGDANGSACKYEWMLNVRSPSAFDMYQFVSSLRQAVRCDQLIQATQVEALHTSMGAQPITRPQQQMPPTCGALEIVLVEARRLKPLDIEQTWHHQASQYLPQEAATYLPGAKLGPLRDGACSGLIGTKPTGDSSSSTPQGRNLSTFVEFRLINNSEELPVRGKKVQTSIKIDDTDSPHWGGLENLQVSGGWPFKTGVIDSEEQPDLLLDFEVKWASYGQVATLGALQVPVFKPLPAVFGTSCLADAQETFKSIWLPLKTEKEGQIVHDPLGLIHILTRWIPPNKLHPPPGITQLTMKEEMGIQAHMHMETRMQKTRLRETIAGSYDMEAQYAIYNPNLVRIADKNPETPAQHFERNVETLHNNMPYLKCINARQEVAWKQFEDTHLNGKPIRETWDEWSREAGAIVAAAPQGQEPPKRDSPLDWLQEVLKTGIPHSRRARYWQDLVGADMSKKSGGDYKSFLNKGLEHPEANMQLQEDGFHLAGLWESTQPPNYKNQDELLKKLRKAQNVCTAVIAQGADVGYCESILVLAFYLILPHGLRLPEVVIQYNAERWVQELSGVLQSAGVTPETSGKVVVKTEKGESKKLQEILSNPQAVREMQFPLRVSDDTETGLSEEDAFWMLVSLCKNCGFRTYYPSSDAAQSAAMKDVSLLETFLYNLDKDLWNYLNAIGFQLCSVFYGAFMRLFASYMPVSTVFRLWDWLFATSRPNQTGEDESLGAGRKLLISFAYSLVRSKKTEILECQSALEVNDLLLGVLGALYDCDTVIEFIDASEKLLWQDLGAMKGNNSKRVLKVYGDREDAWEDTHKIMVEQNKLLRDIMQARPLGYVGRTGDDSSDAMGVSTNAFTSKVVPNLKEELGPQPRERRRARSGRNQAQQDGKDKDKDKDKVKDTAETPIWGMYRPLPLNGSLLGQGWMDKTYKHFEKTFRPQYPPNPYIMKAGAAEEEGKTPEKKTTSAGEPWVEPYFDFEDLTDMMRDIIPNWNDQPKLLWDSFTNRRDLHHLHRPTLDPLAKAGITIENPAINQWITKTFVKAPEKTATDQERMSLNELFLGMAFHSKGTLGEKAAAVFSIFAHSEPATTELHRINPSQLAKILIEQSAIHDARSSVGLTSPPDETLKNDSAIHFKVMSHHHEPKENDEIGHVYIESVGLYCGSSIEECEEQTFNIWPSDDKIKAQQEAMKSQSSGASGAGAQVIGELRVAICWTPKLGAQAEGQLSIRMKSIRFYAIEGMKLDNGKMNPWVVVTTVTRGKEEQIPRWDGPPSHSMSASQHAMRQYKYGGKIHFDSTMRTFGKYPNQTFGVWHLHPEGMGNQGGEWKWNTMWGTQLSKEGLKLSDQQVSLPKSDNTMCVKFARYIVTCLLSRTMVNLSNRQCMLLADSVFNRHGAVPGIIGAILLPSSSASDTKMSLKELKAKNEKNYTDVTGELAVEQERQIRDNGGSFNLFTPAFMDKCQSKVTLQDMGITPDPYKLREKTMVVRFVRGGDGERVTKHLKFSSDGTYMGLADDSSKKELELDLPPSSAPSSLMCTKVTKEEFINCFLNSALLGESLRNMQKYGTESQGNDELALTVIIVDPRHEAQSQEQERAKHLEQSLLLEVWDSDFANKELLGEAWLPALNTLPAFPRDYVLTLEMPNFSEDPDNGPENGPSRHHKWKTAYDVNLPKGPRHKAEGEVYVRLGWVFPAYQVRNEEIFEVTPEGEKKVESIQKPTTLQKEQYRNTGKLTIKVDHGRHLRRSDAMRGRDCDPYVQVWMRNDAMDHSHQWRKEAIYRTKTINNNRNPKWEGPEQVIDIMQGDIEKTANPDSHKSMFERSEKRLSNVFKSKHRKMLDQQKRETASLMRNLETVSVEFGSQSQRHGVKVYLRDAIRDFKAKLLAACEQQAAGGKEEEKILLKDVKVGPKHLVCLHVPPADLMLAEEGQRDLGQKHQKATTTVEEKKRLALEDPRNWQPLDPSRTFETYRKFKDAAEKQRRTGGRAMHPIQIRIMEATDQLKMVNLMYKEFEQKRNKKLPIDTNDDERCYGWAKYTHTLDADSIEWRPAFIGKVHGDPKVTTAAKDLATMKYAVTWLAKTDESAKRAQESKDKDKTGVELDRPSVLLAPRLPKMDNYVHPAHVDVLALAGGLRAGGKSDYEIEPILNKKLEDNQHKPGEIGVPTEKPPRITVDIIRNYLAHNKPH